MVLSHGNALSDTAKMEHIITEFFAKSLHIILESRALDVSLRNSYGGDKSDSLPCSYFSPLPSVRSRDKWFNLALRECPAALESINNLQCLIIDVILVHRSIDRNSMALKRVLPRSSSLKGAKSEKIVERWIVQYDHRKIKDSNSGTRRLRSFSLQNMYKKSTHILRSLYGKVRLLPAYEIFNDLSSSEQNRPFTLAHRVSSFVEPFTLKEESDMMKYRFNHVDTSSGRLCLTVMYCPCPSASHLSRNPLPSLSSQVISNYVRNTLADPLRKFPSLPLGRFPCHDGSPSPRLHSSNFDDCKASCSITDSLLPIYSSSRNFPPGSSAPRLASIKKNGASIDDCCNSSPSPSIHHSCSSTSNTLLRSKSASVRISNAGAVNSSRYTTNVMQSGATTSKVFSLGKDESQKCSGVRISDNALQRISISSRSYRHDFDDTDFRCPFDVDYDDMKLRRSREKSLDRGHVAEALKAGELFPIRKSNDAAVGALVDMLKKARPLHQDFNTSEQHPSVLCIGPRQPAIHTLKVNLTTNPKDISIQNLENEDASIASRKTTSDALEEFHDYREVKNLLVKPDCKPQI